MYFSQYSQIELQVLGSHPVTGDPVELSLGRFGYYVRHKKLNASIPKVWRLWDILDLGLTEGLNLFLQIFEIIPTKDLLNL